MSLTNFSEDFTLPDTVAPAKKEVPENQPIKVDEQTEAIRQVHSRIDALNKSTLDPKTYAAYLEELQKFAQSKQLELKLVRDRHDASKMQIAELARKNSNALHEESRKELLEKVWSLITSIEKWEQNANTTSLLKTVQEIRTALTENNRTKLNTTVRTNFSGIKNGKLLFSQNETNMRLSQVLIAATTDQERDFAGLSIKPGRQEVSKREQLTEAFKRSPEYQNFLLTVQKNWYDEVPEFPEIRRLLLNGSPADIRSMQLAIGMPDDDSARGADGILGKRTLPYTLKYLDAKKEEYVKAKTKKEAAEKVV